MLSSGAVRGRVVRRIDRRRFEVRQSWGVGDGFVKGFLFGWLDHAHEPVPVAGFDASSSVIELERDVAEAPRPAAAFELTTPMEAPILAARIVTDCPADRALPPIDMRLATTRGTNALLERRGADVALVITAGFGDLLLIGDQRRPDLFALHIQRAAPLYREVVEVEERLAADGAVVTPLDLERARTDAARLRSSGIRTAAVALLHGYRNPDHERRLARVLFDAGFEHVSCSSDLSPLIKLLPRTETAVTNAYLAPLFEA